MKKIALALSLTAGLGLTAYAAVEVKGEAAKNHAALQNVMDGKDGAQAGSVHLVKADAPNAPQAAAGDSQAVKSGAEEVKPAIQKEEEGGVKKTLKTVGIAGFVAGWLIAIVSALLLATTQAVVPFLFAGIALAAVSWPLIYFAERIGPGGRGLGQALGNLGGLIGGFILGGLLLGGIGALFGGILGQAAGHYGGQAVENAVREKTPEPAPKNEATPQATLPPGEPAPGTPPSKAAPLI